MKTPRIVEAMQYIDDIFLAEVLEGNTLTKEQLRVRLVWREIKRAVACVLVLFGVTGLFFWIVHPNIDVNQGGPEREYVTLEEAQEHEIFGQYVPEYIMPGYALQDLVLIENGDMNAKFVNEEKEDVLEVTITHCNNRTNVEWNVVQYDSVVVEGAVAPSYVYVNCDEYIVLYHSRFDLNELEGFCEMVLSSAYFRGKLNSSE